ncbi:integrase arm-type DNA-binding domain-containing protein [Pseudorhodoferax sp. Leaf274]|uniref:tyrosine-type recombinase/integrase n=1 Tax=Pseudorhodoferax sp. Leaf274 TaxID=1736318 RepID=UPI0009EA488B|nr:integrase arm-type DNA-binding domain-containing protein [Pseudorhodoferax sp. Leaf274]
MGLLTDLHIRRAVSNGNDYLLADGDGLFLRVRPTGKAWVYRYKQNGRAVKLSLGTYPSVSLASARKAALIEIERRAGGLDPKLERLKAQELSRASKLTTFEPLARAWHAQAGRDRIWSVRHADKVLVQLEKHLFPWLGNLPISEIPSTLLVRCLHRIRDKGHLDTAQRVRGHAVDIFQFAVDLGVLEAAKNFVNPRTAGLPPPRTRHYAAITDPKQLGQLLRDIQAYSGLYVTKAALRIMPMVFQRPGQIRLADWKDISLSEGVWRCPPENMKMREWQKRDSRTPAHVVPLPTQAVAILTELHALTGPEGPVFRSMARRSDKTRFMSENTINSALRTLGYDTKEQITGHGFRATARTLIRECLGWDKEVIERHLAHVSEEELAGSYDRTTFLAQRREMVQAWANLLDDLAAGKEAPVPALTVSAMPSDVTGQKALRSNAPLRFSMTSDGWIAKPPVVGTFAAGLAHRPIGEPAYPKAV